MRTHLVIDDKLMADAMEAGGFNTRREAIEEGLRLIKRRKTYEGLLALRGKLHWMDTDAGWAQYRAEQMALVQAMAAGEPVEGELNPIFQDELLRAQQAQQSVATEPNQPGVAA